jgi:hypothetical protein
MFFAPTQAQKRIKQLGRAGFESQLARAWQTFLVAAQDWISIERVAGEAGLQAVYSSFIAGNADPAKGYIVAL